MVVFVLAAFAVPSPRVDLMCLGLALLSMAFLWTAGKGLG